MNVFCLAEALNKFAHEVEDLSPEEFAYWIAYFNLKSEDNKRRQREAEAKARSRRGRQGRR